MVSSLWHDFEANVQTHPNDIAINYYFYLTTNFTYKELNDYINFIHNELIRYIKSECIGIVSKHHYMLPILMFSAIKSESTFVLIDPVINLDLVHRLQIPWLLLYTDSEESDENSMFSDFLLQNANLQYIFKLKESVHNIQLWKINYTASKYDLTNICYIISTSGTTGESKIVRVTNECIYSNIKCLRSIFNITTSDVIYLGTPVTFDPIYIETFLALCSGATLKIISPKIHSRPNILLEALFIKGDKKITFMQMPPSLFLRWSEIDIRNTILSESSSLRTLVIGGENFDRNILLLNCSSHISIYNIYGITEVSCWASISKLEYEHSSDVSIGNALDDTILQVRKEDGELIEENGEGEIFIGSSTRICLLNDEKYPELAMPVFRSTGDIVVLKNKKIYYLTRKNDVFKRYGNKISLTDIEYRIRNNIHLQCCCIFVESQLKLALFVIINEQKQESIVRIKDKLRVKLLNCLSKQQMPDHIEILSQMPITAHGKVDKSQLKSIFETKRLSTCSNLKPSELYKSLCSKYLGMNEADLFKHERKNFYELGGNSISLLQLVNEFKETYQSELIENILYRFYNELCFQDCFIKCRNISSESVTKRSFPESTSFETKRKCNDYVEYMPLKISWKYNMEACVDASPTLCQTLSETYIAIGSFSHKFAVLNASNGTEVFSKMFPDALESASCLSQCKNHIYIGCYDGFLYCIHITTGDIIWKYKTESRIKCVPCLAGDTVIVGSYDNYLHCVDYQSGKKVWKRMVSASVTSKPIYNSQFETVYIATLRGTYFCLSLIDGSTIWKHEVQIPVFSSPIFINASDSAIVWADVKGTLKCFDAQTGSEIWTYTADGQVFSSLIKYESKIIFGCYDKYMYCLQYDNVKCWLCYKINLSDLVSSTPCAFKICNMDVVAAVTNSGKMYLIKLQNGVILNSIDFTNEMYSSPLFYADKLYVGCRDNYFYCIDVK